MELKQYIQYILSYWIFILVLAVGAGVVGFVAASQRPAMYNVVQSYEVQLVNRNSTPDYQYGSYYDLRGAEIMVQHLMSLLRDASVIEEIYQKADVAYTIDNYSRFTNQFRADQPSTQLMTVTFSQVQEDQAKAIAQSMTAILTERTVNSQVDVEGKNQFDLRSSQPVILYKEPPVVLATVVGVLAGAFLAIVLVFSKRYLTN